MNNATAELRLTVLQRMKSRSVRTLANLKSLKQFIYNPATNEVLCRDGLSWAKISLFYCLFYSCLGGLFVFFLFVFTLATSRVSPTYYGQFSCMATAKNEATGRKGVNPGLGFRPQLDPESTLIYFNLNQSNTSLEIIKNLQNFLKNNRLNQNSTQGLNCLGFDLATTRSKLNSGLHCTYSAEEVLNGTPCSQQNNFNYAPTNASSQHGPCVLVKVNKIYSWLPHPYPLEQLPVAIDIPEVRNQSVLQNNILIKCQGEHEADREALRTTQIVYYSPVSNELNTDVIGYVPFFYYPYLNQAHYTQPLVFVEFRGLPVNMLVNVVCRAYAQNIDSEDSLNRRGLTLFKLFARTSRI